MTVTTILGWVVLAKVVFSIPLAFFFGFLFASWSMVKSGISWREAIRAAVGTETSSIFSMETVDSAFLLLIPGAMNAYIGNPIYWYKIIAALVVAFIITVPVNRYLISRNPHKYHHH